MTPTDVAQQTYLENRLETLVDSQMDVVHAAIAARRYFETLPKQRLCPKEIARLEHCALEAERRSYHLTRAIAAVGAELALYR
ncbi:hypothetical protein [Candidatus Viridilinea mediisalina]|uniref:Uncharacterized protein n=1 Tax=Candidatus Viridilinea mediisalina TaxID=2024553 RepID=A0A2A6RNH1_9CHLR|nr:hypothetical protein [Candidatus Viridilinea mediisalina]PDW04612.1 hypothetical protein CJ255_02875 [Candidatus Viridilinea mediisalina]